MNSQGAASGSEGTLRTRAYDNFCQQIMLANIVAGQFVSQRELAELLNMPLGAVREMIPRLEAEGLIRTVPQRGLQIAHVDLKLINNAFDLRLILEKEAAARFAASVSDDELEGIYASHREIIARARGGAEDAALLDEAQKLDWGLHDRMIDAMGNELVSEIYRVNSLRLRLIRLEGTMISPDRLVPAMEEHLSVIDAFKSRQPSLAAEMVAVHIESAHQRLLAWPARDRK
jgi:DNA-binding GntR family transcriptional regulator